MTVLLGGIKALHAAGYPIEEATPGAAATVPQASRGRSERTTIDVLGTLRDALAPHYIVEREIGAGGMGRVYLARERHPARQVAIKVMAPELSTAGFRARFIREVELTATLNHPNIVPILAADECLFVPDGPDGLCYYIMPYIEGESLRVHLARRGTLPLAEALGIAFQVADALSYAHARGIIHRDIKPENILLADGRAFVADFGIARAISAAGGGTLTGVGQPVGSVGYMSPEQLVGSRALDARTDVYSLACVLYEMLVGQPPLLDLAGRTAPDRAALTTALRAQGVRHRTARLLSEAIGRALAASPAERFTSVDDFVARARAALAGRESRAWLPSISRKVAITGGGAALLVAAGFALFTTRAPALDPRRVAVSGFEDHSADPTLAPLGHLATGWVTQALTRGGRVEVVAAAAAGHLDPAGIQVLAARTGAGTVVVGSYYRDGDSVRFHVQIVDAVRGTVWRALDPVAAPRRAPLEAADAVRRRVAAVFDTLFAAR